MALVYQHRLYRSVHVQGGKPKRGCGGKPISLKLRDNDRHVNVTVLVSLIATARTIQVHLGIGKQRKYCLLVATHFYQSRLLSIISVLWFCLLIPCNILALVSWPARPCKKDTLPLCSLASTHKADVQPPTAVVHDFRRVNVVIRQLFPICNFVNSHSVIAIFIGQR